MDKISLNDTMRVRLTADGINRYLEYVDNKVSELSDKYSLTKTELISYQLILESKLNCGILTAPLCELIEILAPCPARYIEGSTLEFVDTNGN